MALTSSVLLKSPKFLCNYMRILPPSTVVCYVHSQLAVQPYDVRICVMSFKLNYLLFPDMCTMYTYNLKFLLVLDYVQCAVTVQIRSNQKKQY